jgi:hypothetical protein
VELLRRIEQSDLARGWGAYLETLLPLSRTPGPQTEWTIGIGDVLRAHAAAMLEVIPSRATQRSQRHLSHAAFVAETHGLEAAADAAGDVGMVARRIAGFAAA